MNAMNDVKGKNAHDARLVAAMQRHGLTDLLSFNKPDFTRFTAINAFTPAEVLDGQISQARKPGLFMVRGGTRALCCSRIRKNSGVTRVHGLTSCEASYGTMNNPG
ncbi:MAG TPA: hypothetical protein VMV69_17290 [Pirellulales bacterium]|nr:hypothetical protein [Pirellulales bacterium]